MENRFDGAAQAESGGFLSRKQKGRVGVGLDSVSDTAARYGGSAEFYVREAPFYSEVFLAKQPGA